MSNCRAQLVIEWILWTVLVVRLPLPLQYSYASSLLLLFSLTHLKQLVVVGFAPFFFINDWLRYRQREGGRVCVCEQEGEIHITRHHRIASRRFRSSRASSRARFGPIVCGCFGFALVLLFIIFCSSFSSLFFSHISDTFRTVWILFSLVDTKEFHLTHTQTHTQLGR